MFGNVESMDKESRLLQTIGRKIRDMVIEFDAIPSIVKQKGKSGDYATELDIKCEEAIVAEIKTVFPDDGILAEEGYSDTKLSQNRLWIIDPICGTNNLGRGIRAFCSNIALADKGKLIAACVVDHSTGDIIYSVGDHKVFVNGKLLEIPQGERGSVIEVDLSALLSDTLNTEAKSAYTRFLNILLTTTDYVPVSLGSSLGFTLTAIGKVDGFVNESSNPWDICAGVFLMQQSGGIVTSREGEDWQLGSVGAIAARTTAMHSTLLDAYTKAHASQ